jgi:hypothetical protein
MYLGIYFETVILSSVITLILLACVIGIFCVKYMILVIQGVLSVFKITWTTRTTLFCLRCRCDYCGDRMQKFEHTDGRENEVYPLSY